MTMKKDQKIDLGLFITSWGLPRLNNNKNVGGHNQYYDIIFIFPTELGIAQC